MDIAPITLQATNKLNHQIATAANKNVLLNMDDTLLEQIDLDQLTESRLATIEMPRSTELNKKATAAENSNASEKEENYSQKQLPHLNTDPKNVMCNRTKFPIADLRQSNSDSQVNFENFSFNKLSRNLSNETPSLSQVLHMQTKRNSSSSSSKESGQQKWQFKILSDASQAQKSVSQRRIITRAAPGKFTGSYDLQTDDVCTNDMFNTFLEENVSSKVSMQSPVLFSPSDSSGNSSKPGNSFNSGSKLDMQCQSSQLFKSSQVIKKIDEVISRRQSMNTIVNSHSSHLGDRTQKRKSLEKLTGRAKLQREENKENISTRSELNQSTNDDENRDDSKIEYRMTQLLKSSQYRKEVSQMFERVEQSICQFGTEWPDESFMTKTVLEGVTQQSKGSLISDAIKRALKANANRGVAPENLVNRTLPGSNQAIFRQMGPFYGLPDKVMELIKLYKGIEKLYDWQDECLNLSAVAKRTNLLYCLPTSGGKTLVAEILILREIICRKRNAILVLPYVAIVQEKVWALSPFAVALDFLIEEYAAGKGTYPPKKRRYKNSVFIATTEKALGLVNSLVEQGRLEELGLVVVDELHLIGDEQRGPVLESLLTKLMYLNEDIQIVGMSATIGNLQDIKKFLKADLYTRNFRPVELIEYVKCENEMAKINLNAAENNIFQLVRQFQSDGNNLNELNNVDPDLLRTLVSEVIPQESCLIFCASKRNCENVARLLCRILSSKLKEHKAVERQQLIKALRNDSDELCDTLKVSVQYGIAYHHSGLTSEERRLIEEAFRTGILCVICCTSTLAAGVNLPAKRVIIRRPYIARDFISLSRYKQMVGRAGRTGFGEVGESILICEKKDLKKVNELLMSPMDQTLSKMHEKENSYLRLLFLSCISLGTANTKAQLEKVANKTLLAVQQEKLNVDMKQLTRKVISDLFVLGAVQMFDDSNKNSKSNSGSLNDVSVYVNASDLSMEQNGSIQAGDNSNRRKTRRRLVLQAHDKLVVSKLGSAAIKGCMDLAKAHTLYEDLQKAQESLVLINCLHLLYLVTPYNLPEQNRIDRNQYHTIMMGLGSNERKTAAILGITDSCIIRLYSNKNIKSVSLGVLNRFYISLMLYDLWNEIPVADVSEKYQMDRGTVQNLMTNAATFASNVVNFCEELEEFWAFAHLLKGMNQRLAHCCCRELLPLMELPAVKQGRAKQLYNAGFKNLQSIARADPNDIIQAIEFISRRLANQLIAAAKLLLLEKVETLREEAEDMLDGVERPNLVFNQSFLK